MMNKFFRRLAVLFTVAFALIACENNTELNDLEEERAYIIENQEFMKSRALEMDANGVLKYTAVIVGTGGVNNTVLFRVLEEGTSNISPSLDSDVRFEDMEGRLKDGIVFQKPFSAIFAPEELIIGLREALLVQHVGEKLETIIPANLGYGLNYIPGIPIGSALVFTYTIVDVIK